MSTNVETRAAPPRMVTATPVLRVREPKSSSGSSGVGGAAPHGDEHGQEGGRGGEGAEDGREAQPWSAMPSAALDERHAEAGNGGGSLPVEAATPTPFRKDSANQGDGGDQHGHGDEEVGGRRPGRSQGRRRACGQRCSWATRCAGCF